MKTSIVTVALPYHSEFILKNAKILQKINIDKWVVVGCDSETNRKIQLIDKRFISINSAVFETKYGAIASGVQHSKSLKLGLDIIETKNVIILDPDFLILNANQLEILINDFTKSDKKIIGTPYFPIWYNKRINTVGIYLAITTRNFLIEEIDLYPKNLLNTYSSAKLVKTNERKYIKLITNFLKRSRLVELLYTLSFRRFKINSDFDICADIENYYANNKIEFLTIEITSDQLLKISPHLGYKIGRFLEKVIHREFSYLPNNYNLFDTKSLLTEKQVEHYSYRNVLIGGHFRVFGNQNKIGIEHYTSDVIENYLNSVSSFNG